MQNSDYMKDYISFFYVNKYVSNNKIVMHQFYIVNILYNFNISYSYILLIFT